MTASISSVQTSLNIIWVTQHNKENYGCTWQCTYWICIFTSHCYVRLHPAADWHREFAICPSLKKLRNSDGRNSLLQSNYVWKAAVKALENNLPQRSSLLFTRDVTACFNTECYLNTFAASFLNTQGLNNSCLKSPASTLVDLTFQPRALRSFSLNQLRNLSL